MRITAIVAVCLLSLSIGCKDEKPAQEDIENSKEETFKVSLNLVISKDDSLQVFYTEDLDGIYEDQNSVWAVVKGSEQEQVATFDLPEDVIPSQLRIDLGQNRDQKEVAIKSFKMEYLGAKFEVKDTMFYQYFQPVNQIDWDRKKAVAKITSTAEQKHDPSFYPRETLKESINNLIMSSNTENVKSK
jgi:hypothetical protein